MPKASALRLSARSSARSRFEIGDLVILEADGRVGRIIGIRYGDIAYDIHVKDGFLRNVPPEQIRARREDGRAA